MNIATCKLIFINLSAMIFVVNAGKGRETECKVKWNKTEAFMYVFENLQMLLTYQRELINRFLQAHENHLQDMFEDPITWCIKKYKVFGAKTRGNLTHKGYCIESMNQKNKTNFTESRKSALKIMFLRLRCNGKCQFTKVMQKKYMEYVKPIIDKYVEYTSARGPLDYCKNIEPRVRSLPVDQNGNVVYNLHLNVHETRQFQFDPLASSSGASKSTLDIDLNNSPPSESA